MTPERFADMLEALMHDVHNVVGGCVLVERCAVDQYSLEVLAAARVLEGKLSILLARARGGHA
jgi:hypothetical protein